MTKHRIAICEKHGLVGSMSRKGGSPDNSAMEGFFGRLKNEFFRHRDWSGVSIPEFCRMLDAYLRYYNEGRPKERLGRMSPMRCRRSLGLAAWPVQRNVRTPTSKDRLRLYLRFVLNAEKRARTQWHPVLLAGPILG